MRGVTAQIRLPVHRTAHFNSHASCEAWPPKSLDQLWLYKFQLTRLMRGVTVTQACRWFIFVISTHTPHARRDEKPTFILIESSDFNSHASCEAWRWAEFMHKQNIEISTHTPHARRDAVTMQTERATRHFNSHASCEAWQDDRSSDTGYRYFNSHASCEAWRLYSESVFLRDLISTHTPHARRDFSTTTASSLLL